MPGVKRRKAYFTSLTENHYDSSEYEDKKYCVHCESYGSPYQELKARVYQPHELINGQIPSDHEAWSQCYQCGTIYPVEHGKQENTITGIKEVPESIHDSKRLYVGPFVKPRTRKHKRKSRQEPEELDDFIQEKVQHGSKLISYQDNSPDI